MLPILALLIPILAISCTYEIVKRILDDKAKALEGNNSVKELVGMEERILVLQDRIEQLEDIIQSDDYELNKKLAQLPVNDSKNLGDHSSKQLTS